MLFLFVFLFILVPDVRCHPKQIIDLTHTFANGYTITWPSATPVYIT